MGHMTLGVTSLGLCITTLGHETYYSAEYTDTPISTFSCQIIILLCTYLYKIYLDFTWPFEYNEGGAVFVSDEAPNGGHLVSEYACSVEISPEHILLFTITLYIKIRKKCLHTYCKIQNIEYT